MTAGLNMLSIGTLYTIVWMSLFHLIGNWHAEGTSYGEGQDANNPEVSGVTWVSDELMNGFQETFLYGISGILKLEIVLL
jgi:hypothetical protein